MSELLFKICAVAAVSSMLILLVKKWGGELGVLLKIASAITLAAICFGAVSPVIEYIKDLSTLGETEGIAESAEFLLRVLAVAMVTHISATVCRDCGEASLASYVELGGKVEIILLSLPLIKSMVDLTVELL